VGLYTHYDKNAPPIKKQTPAKKRALLDTRTTHCVLILPNYSTAILLKK